MNSDNKPQKQPADAHGGCRTAEKEPSEADVLALSAQLLEKNKEAYARLSQ